MASSLARPETEGPRSPSPATWRGAPIVGALADLRKDQLGTLERMAELGSPVSFRILNKRLHLLSDPDQIDRALVGNVRAYDKRTVGYDHLRTVVGNGLLTSEGGFWRRQRRIAQPAFKRPRIEGFAAIMTESAEDMVESWRDGEVVDILREMMRVTMRIAGLSLLSRDVSAAADEVGEALTTAIEHVSYRTETPWAPPDWVPTPRNRQFRAALATLDRVVADILRARRAGQTEQGDLLDILMTATDPETGEGMSDEQLRDEVMTIFLAGHETTAVALAWTFDLLGRHPDVAARLREEVDGALGGRAPTIDDLPRLPYAEKVLYESMRLYPPAWMVERSAAVDHEIAGHPIRRGDWVLISPWVTHRRADIWPDPSRFDPERFGPESREKARPRYAYFPFGGGQRKCIGDRFALVEARLILAAVVQRASLEATREHPPAPDPLVTLRPGGGTPMRVALRR